jgi:hypothetical protein
MYKQRVILGNFESATVIVDFLFCQALHGHWGGFGFDKRLMYEVCELSAE